ncbi:RagB/SusD family nutrient uptake outer membrane protein [Arachidicoccus sp.]|uniref:RagB/SusD family nutrient uptake outer membrane protein n=1 Tax=Arachidicoccus sp. TaxID=1872624 RepID=UPI003D1DEEC0
MKKLLIILIVVVALATSCNKLLNESPKYSVNNTNVFNSATTTQTALNACYGWLISWNAYGQAYFELTVGASGLSWAQTNGGDQDQLASFNTLNTNGTLGQVWAGMYKTIGECNSFIENVYGGSLSNAQKNYYAAQARFIRGLCYFNLAGIYGDVPLRISASNVDSVNMSRTPKAEVYKQVAADWQFAAQYLPTSDNSTETAAAVPTRYAAYAYLAKLYWFLGSNDNTPMSPNWAIAKTYGDSVLSAGSYALESKFSNLFIDGTNNSKEIIFKLNVSTALNGLGSRISWVFAPSKSTTGISWGRFKFSKGFYDLFKGTYNDDPRLTASCATTFKNVSNGSISYTYPYISYKVAGQTVVDSLHYSLLQTPTPPTVAELNSQNPKLVSTFTAATGANEGWPYYNKYTDPTATAQLGKKQILVYRYADFLLLMADVNNELGNSATAVSLLNQVLTRARTSVTPAATYPQNVNNSLSQAQLRDKIFYERLFELAGEPDMFFDTRRRGTEYLKKVLSIYNNDSISYAFATNPAVSGNNFKDRLVNGGNLSSDFLKKNLLLPIPQSELNTNTSITPADQNFGY